MYMCTYIYIYIYIIYICTGIFHSYEMMRCTIIHDISLREIGREGGGKEQEGG